MARMNVDGNPDMTFGTGGYVSLTGPVLSTFVPATMRILENGKILVGGNVQGDFALIRFNADGSLDTAKLVPAGRSSKSKIRDLFRAGPENVSPELWGNGGLVTAGILNRSEFLTSAEIDAVGRLAAAGTSNITLPNQSPTYQLTMARFLNDASPTANIYGTIRTAEGMPIRNISVVLSEGGLSEPRYALTNQFGLYSFGDLPLTESYSISISSKRFSFAVDQKIISLLHDEESVDFTALP
jgi:hypothetical protein